MDSSGSNEIRDKIEQIIRTTLLALLMVGLGFLCIVRLLQIQIADIYGFSSEQERPTRTATQSIQAVRGQIADRSAMPLNTNEVVHKVILQRAFLPFDEENEMIALVLEVLEKHNSGHDEPENRWFDTLPITREQPFEFKDVPREELDLFLSNLGLNLDATVEHVIRALAENYSISSEQSGDCPQKIRNIGGVRYEMEAAHFSFQNRYVLAEDISLDSVIELVERSFMLPGVDIIEEATRSYTHGEILPHIRGRLTAISQEQFAALRDSGYSRGDLIGLFGIEQSMESVLRGENGILEITREITHGAGSGWELISAETTLEPRAGHSVMLTIDAEFQGQVEAILRNHLDHLNRNENNRNVQRYPTEEGARSGAIAVMCVKTGGILALATEPTYDLNDYIELLLAEAQGEPLLPYSPLRNRATEWGFRPGSTYKTITAVIGLMEGAITRACRISCGGRYWLFNNPRCWETSACGSLSVARALADSCNVFFYEVTRRLGAEAFAQQSIDLFGVGTDLNIDVRSEPGRMTTADIFEGLHGRNMGGADLVQAGIGQSETLMTPLHLASAAATVANNGVRLRPHLVHSVWNYDFTELIHETQPQIVSDAFANVNNCPETRELITTALTATQEGLLERAVMNRRFYTHLTDGNMPAYKTGTPELIPGYLYNSTAMGYYPAENPQIAFAIVIEGGDRASRSIRNIINAYFYGDFEPLPEEASGEFFHVPWDAPREPLAGRYGGRLITELGE
ncbi:MAG: penicillin-binding transpeptidase domain-containing protein [Oscillospiraceae bacterium]|nr:penicillin-binding transpeptidase domain-containing protein [Oscillospiraceae bacterium]